MHSTNNLYDGYIGSGQLLWKSIKKHGKGQHVCEILEYLDDRKSLSAREEELLTKELLVNPLCMNLRAGGLGAYPGRPTSEETKRKLSLLRIGKAVERSPESYARMSDALRKKSQWNRAFTVTTPDRKFVIPSLWEVEKLGMQIASAKMLATHGQPSRRGKFKGWIIQENY